MEERGNCHIRMPSLRSSMAATPPPLALNVDPNVLVPASTPQPALESVLFKQFVVRTFPDSFRLTPIEHPAAVCSVIWFCASETTLTASMTSISPLVGQFAGSETQRAGHVPQPIGVWMTSKMKRPEAYCFLDWRRTEKRPVEALGTVSVVTVVSTLSMAEELVVVVRLY